MKICGITLYNKSVNPIFVVLIVALQEKDVMASTNPDLHFNSATVSLFLPSSLLFLKLIFFIFSSFDFQAE